MRLFFKAKEEIMVIIIKCSLSYFVLRCETVENYVTHPFVRISESFLCACLSAFVCSITCLCISVCVCMHAFMHTYM